MNMKYIITGTIVMLMMFVSVSAYEKQWSVNTGIFNTTKTPLVFDIDGDGFGEVFETGLTLEGNARIVAIDGKDGTIMWVDEWNQGYIDVQIPMSIGDLNNDGTYEIVTSYGMTKTIARNCEDGSVLWNVDVDAGWHHLAIADTDDNGLPYVYVSQHTGGGINGHIAKIKGTDGTLVAEHQIYYPCYGGISIADLTGDGDYEIIINDHDYIWCFDEDLNEVWKHPGAGESSCPNIIDVNGDGNLDVVTLRGISTNGGLTVVDGLTGLIINTGTNLGLPVHITTTVHDIDKDGKVELLTSYGSGGGGTHIFDLVDWKLDYEFPNEGKYYMSYPPVVANVYGDEDLEIVFDGLWVGRIYIYDSEYNEVSFLPSWGKLMVNDIDSDGFNDIILAKISSNTPIDIIECWSTDAISLGAENRDHYFGLHRTNAEVPYVSANRDIESVEYEVCWQCDGTTKISKEFPPGTICGEKNSVAENYPYLTEPEDCTVPNDVCWVCIEGELHNIEVIHGEDCPTGYSKIQPICEPVIPGFELPLLLITFIGLILYTKKDIFYRKIYKK